MPEYTLRIRRYDPQSGEAAYWEDHTVEMGAKQSVLDAILKIKDDADGSIGIRCSCQQAICGSCGVRMNGKPGLACNTHLEEAAARVHGVGWNPEPGTDGAATSEVIGVDPMSQIMRLRRRAGSDEHINDRNNGHRHESAFVTLVGQYGLLNEAELLPRSYGGDSWFGKFHPAAGKELLSSLPTVIGGLL